MPPGEIESSTTTIMTFFDVAVEGELRAEDFFQRRIENGREEVADQDHADDPADAADDAR